MATSFSIGNALSFGWESMKKNFLLFLYICLTLLALQVVVSATEHTDPALVIAVVVIAISMILKLGLLRITLNLVDKKRFEYRQLASQANRFPDYIVATVLYALIVIGGLILLIVPGIIWAIKFQFYGYHIVDKKMGPIKALKASAKTTKGHKWDLFVLWLAIIGINILGALALLVGLFATVPTSWVAMAWTFRKLDR